MRKVVSTLLVFAMLCGAAQAYSPNIGDRANDIFGRDACTDKVAHLTDHLGHWTFIDFWASWCGPCMGELPNLLEQTKDLRSSGRLDLFSVSLDAMETADDMNKVIREMGLDYPVLFDGNAWSSVQAVEWGIHSIPATYLIDPQGNVVAKGLRGESLRPGLDYFLNQQGPTPPIGMRAAAKKNDDGSVDVRVELDSPRRQPLKVQVDYAFYRYAWAPEDPEHKGRPISSETIEQDPANPEVTSTVEFKDACESVQVFHVPAVENTHRFGWEVSIELPGTEALVNGKGLWISERGREKISD